MTRQITIACDIRYRYVNNTTKGPYRALHSNKVAGNKLTLFIYVNHVHHCVLLPSQEGVFKTKIFICLSVNQDKSHWSLLHRRFVA